MIKFRVAVKKHEDTVYKRYPIRAILNLDNRLFVSFGPLHGDEVGAGFVPTDPVYSIIFEFCIGCQDKNDRDIYWGDILYLSRTYAVNQHFIVIGDDTTMTYCIREYDMEAHQIGCHCGGVDLSLCEIVGQEAF